MSETITLPVAVMPDGMHRTYGVWIGPFKAGRIKACEQSYGFDWLEVVHEETRSSLERSVSHLWSTKIDPIVDVEVHGTKKEFFLVLISQWGYRTQPDWRLGVYAGYVVQLGPDRYFRPVRQEILDLALPHFEP